LFTDADLVRGRSRGVLVAAALRCTRHIRSIAALDPSVRVLSSDARTSIRNLLWRGRWFSVGDAAWFLDPLSGNGIERAVESGVAAAAAICAAVDGNADALRAAAIGRVAAFRSALAAQEAIYSRERRWSAHPFWRRRTRLVSGGDSALPH
jgi:flavin-dependent dehydrogenase